MGSKGIVNSLGLRIIIRMPQTYSMEEMLRLRSSSTGDRLQANSKFTMFMERSDVLMRAAAKPYNKNQGVLKSKDEICEDILNGKKESVIVPATTPVASRTSTPSPK